MKINKILLLNLVFANLWFVGCQHVIHNVENKEKIGNEELYVAKPFTSAHGFTDGIEGPACDKQGTLYVVNYSKQGTIGSVSADGRCAVYLELPVPSIGNGIRFRRDGTMLIADYVGHNIYQVDPLTKKLTVFAHDPTMAQPNDICITSSGIVFASDPKWADASGKLWRADLKGKLVCLEQKMSTTNGIDVSPDEKMLYVNVSNDPRIWVYDLNAKGKLSHKRLFIEFKDFSLDGMRTDMDGNLYVARAGKGTVAKVSPSGKVLLEVKLHGPRPTNVCFGGPDGRTVYVTEAENGRIESFRVEKPGREWKLWQK